jgi:predicted AAA+ superfamily ATPase
MYIKRALANVISRFIKFPVVGVFGPRQSGKTVLVQQIFKKHTYLNFEDPLIRAYAQESPREFLREYENKNGVILDEFQYVPEILSYIQLESDAKDRPGYFVLTGSQNFLTNQAVTQSLAGRIGTLTLLPLSIQELKQAKLLDKKISDALFSGCYPRIFAKDISPLEFYPSYVHSYIERDVRQLINVANLSTFQSFLELCAGRVGQLLNIADLAVSCGISQQTVKSWLSILQASYIVYLLRPYHTNFNKRITKTPKLYFYDTGLACWLLKIRAAHDLAVSSFRGSLFENYIIGDLIKQYYNDGTDAPIYFWRDLNGRTEVDCLIDGGVKLTAIEIKAGETSATGYFEGLKRWNEIADTPPTHNYVVYTGEHNQTRSTGNLVTWQSAGSLVKKL